MTKIIIIYKTIIKQKIENLSNINSFLITALKMLHYQL